MRYFIQILLSLRNIAIFLFLFSFCHSLSGQNQYLLISSTHADEQKKIDSIGFVSQHQNAKSVLSEVSSFSDKLLQQGYIELEIEQYSKSNDSTFAYQFRLGKKTPYLYIYKRKSVQFEELWSTNKNEDTIKVAMTEVENFLKNTLAKLEKDGFALSKIKLSDFAIKGNKLTAALTLKKESQRRLSDIVIKGVEKFPENHRRQLVNSYKKRIFNQENLKNIYQDIEKFRFVKQVKFPEILFKTDSTKVYCYVSKSKTNTFDGFIGFSNNESQDLVVNGYIDLVLNNLLNTGETLAINWKSNGEDQKTFSASIELPYIFNSPLAIKTHLNIFKQDSTFQNTETAINLGYLFNYNKRLFLGYQSSESSDIQNTNTINLSDYSNSFITTQFQFFDFKTDEFVFPEKTRIDLKAGIGSRLAKFNKNDQTFFNFDVKHIFFLNQKNNIQIRSHNYFLKSTEYIVNELYRFGGINSIRGFNENSLQANLFSSVLSEYRYVIAPNFYIHSITDYGYYDDQTTETKGSLLGLGLGFGLLTKNGLFNLVYANGSSGGQEIQGRNSIIHVSFKTQF